MKAVKLIYSAHYYHLLSFSSEYRKHFSQLFKQDGLKYTIENENSINEALQLIYPNEGFIIKINKSAIVLIYEGDFFEINKSSSTPMETFLLCLNIISKLDGFTAFLNHQIQSNVIFENKKSTQELSSTLLKESPFKKLEQMSSTYEFSENDYRKLITIGNYDPRDIETFQLDILKTQTNKLLYSAKGYIVNYTIKKVVNSISFTKYKELVFELKNDLEKIEKWL